MIDVHWRKATRALLFGELARPVWIRGLHSVQRAPSMQRSWLRVLLPSDDVLIAVLPSDSHDGVQSMSQQLPERDPW